MAEVYADPMRSGAPTGAPAGYSDPKAIDALLKSSSPETVANAGRSYQAFAAAYEKLAGELLAMRTDLHEAWSGTDAAAAQSALREIWSASATVQSTAQRFGIALERHGTESLAWYKYNKPPSKNLADARSWMTGANERISQSWGSLPEEIATTLPSTDGRVEHGPASTSRSGRTAATTQAAGGGGTTRQGRSRSPAGADGGHAPATQEPASRAAGSGTRLAGLPGGSAGIGPGNSTPPPPGDGGIGGPAPTVSGGMPTLSTPEAGFLGNAGQNVIGGRSPVGSPPSDEPAELRGGAPLQGGSEEAGAPGRTSVSRSGTFGPAAGTGDAGGERERERRTWLAEDEEVWIGKVQAAPEVIGEGPARAEVFANTTGKGQADGLDELGMLLDELGDGDGLDSAFEVADRRRRSRLPTLHEGGGRGGDPVNGDVPAVPDWVFGDDG